MKKFRAIVISSKSGFEEGSSLVIDRQTKCYYFGVWPSMCGSYSFKIHKNTFKKYCERDSYATTRY